MVRHGALDGFGGCFGAAGVRTRAAVGLSEPLLVFPYHGQMYALKPGNCTRRLLPDYNTVSTPVNSGFKIITISITFVYSLLIFNVHVFVC